MGERRLLITAGPTWEPLDAVRYIANRSSGRMGIALAEAGRDAGWQVRLLLGPVSLPPPEGVAIERFESARDLEALLAQRFGECDVLIMAAAVADYRPQQPAAGKTPRRAEGLTIELEPTPDLVAQCAARKQPTQRIIGFALEEPAVLAPRAQEKLQRKGLDAIVANPLETMGAEGVEAKMLWADGRECVFPRGDKGDFAAWLVREIANSEA